MGKLKRQRRHLRDLIWKRQETHPKVLEARRVAFSILIEGLQPYSFLRGLAWNDCTIQRPKLVFKEMMNIGDEIIQMARHSMEKARESITPGTVISFDGSWDHRRRGSNCILAVFSCQTQKIIECQVVSNKVAPTSENFCESPTLMESKALSLVIPRLKGDDRICGYVHDLDAKASKMIEDAGWEIRGYLDPGHCMKAFKKRLTKFEEENHGILKGIEGSLIRWMGTVMHYDGPVEEKLELWRNCVKHYIGDHTHCLHGHVPVHYWDKATEKGAVDALKKFVTSTEFIIESCSTEFDTQSNESFNRTKLKYATKDVKWGKSWEYRMMCAVLDRNEAYWKLKLFDRLQIGEMTVECRSYLMMWEDARLRRKRLVHSEDYKKKRMKERKEAQKPRPMNRREIILYEYEMPPQQG